MMAISNAPARARKHRLAVFVPAATCGTKPEVDIDLAPKIPSPLSSQHVHPQRRQPRGLAALPGWEPGPPYVTHDLEREPEVDDGDNPARVGPATCTPLRVAVPFGVDPGAVEPYKEQDAQAEHRDIGCLVQPEVREVVHASRAEQLDGQPDADEGDNNGQQSGKGVRQPGPALRAHCLHRCHGFGLR